MLPDTSDTDKMALIGRQTVLRKARRETAQKLRDKLVPLLNSIELQDHAWDVDGLMPLIDQIKEINHALGELG